MARLVSLALAVVMLAWTFFLAALLLAGQSHAAQRGPPPNGWYGAFAMPQIVCDTQEQIASIAAAGAKDNDALQARLAELIRFRNEKGESTCAVLDVGPVAVGESIQLGLVHALQGMNETWAVHIGNAQGDWWILYGSPVEGGVPPANYGPPSGVQNGISYIVAKP